MNINTKNLVSITDANQNFSKVARLVDENGSVIILKNNVPRYLVMEFSAAEQEQLADDEDIMAISKRLIEKNRQAYEVLAKRSDYPKRKYFCSTNSSLQRPEVHLAYAMKGCWTLH